MSDKNKVVVTGLGICSSIGCNISDFTDSLKLGKSGISESTFFKEMCSEITVAAEVGPISLKEYVNQIKCCSELKDKFKPFFRKNLMLESSIISAYQAMEESKLCDSERCINSDRISIVTAGSNLNQQLQFSTIERYHDSMEYVTPNYALQFFDTNVIGAISEIFSICGEGFTIGGASASGNSAMIHAYRLIESGISDVCLVVGPMINLSPYELQSFRNLGALGGNKYSDDAKSACRPFDADHEGFILGQGSGCIVLESEESAKKRKMNILAEIAGGSIKLDGNRLSDARIDGELNAMRRALQDADISIDEVDYINAHGTSTPLGDEVELKAIKELLKDRSNHVWVNSTKGLAGHCMFSAGVIEAIACIIQIRDGFIHPNINLDHPISDEVRLAGRELIKDNIKVALSNSFGFGGINTSIVIKKYKEEIA